MIRVLLIARYHSDMMKRKVDLLASISDLELQLVCPRERGDVCAQREQQPSRMARFQQVSLPMVGDPADPHRALYLSLTLGLCHFRPDVIHAEEEPDSLAALQIALYRRTWAPRARLLLHTWQNVDRPKGLLVRLVLQTTLHEADAIFCANGEGRDLLLQMGYDRPVVVLPAIGVDTTVFAPRSRPARADGAFVVGYVGRFVPEKGIDTLLAAFSTVVESGGAPPCPCRLVLAGDGPMRGAIGEWIASRNMGERVRVLPHVGHEDVASLMAQLDVLVLPSRTTSVWKEQFGRVLTEAMACKTPVIGSDSGAIPEVIGDAGLVFPEGDAAALAGCLRLLITSPSLQQALAERAYQRVMALYSQEQIAARTAAFYRRMMECL